MSKSIRNFWGLVPEKKSVPAVSTISENKRGGINKAYIPKFLYKPPFGFPRYVNLPNIRRLASTPYVDMCITTIIDEMCSIKWDIVPKDGVDPESAKGHIKEVKDFLENPNTNKESLEDIRRKYLRDILEVDAGVINKIFNLKQEMVEIVARDGGTFTKNPNIYGMITDRDDIIIEPGISSSKVQIDQGWLNPADAREKAAYFQYGWITGAKPVPFGKKELIWFERNPRTDSVYGRSPVQVLEETIQTLIYSIEHNLEYFNDNSIPKGIIGLEGSNSEEINSFKEQWEQQQVKKDPAGNWKHIFHKLPIVNTMPKFERLQFTNAELELLEGQKWWAKLVWACFGVTSVELGYTEDSKGLANQIVQSNVFKKRSINPLLRLEEYKYNHEIIPEFDFEDVEFKFLQFDVEEETKKAQLYKVQLDAGYKSINEIRTEEGLDEVDWGNKESESDKFNRENQFGQDQFNQDGQNPLKKEENNLRDQTKPASKLDEKKNEKSYKDNQIEGKPGMGHSDKWWEMYHALIKEGNSKESAAKITNSKIEEKSSITNNPLILGPNEEIGEVKLKKGINYVLEENKKKIKELIKKEMEKETILQIKSLDGIAKSIKIILSFKGLKELSDKAIQNLFLKGWYSAEKQLDRNFLVNKEAVNYIQNYTFNNIQAMTDELKTDLRQELERGIMNGEGITKITERVDNVFKSGKNRAEKISRTEISRAESQGKLEGFKASGEKLMKKWVAANDARTCANCKRMDGQVVGINENFKDKKTGFESPIPLYHPCCRCTAVYFNKEKE